MGRAPCCDKANVKKGPWSPEEDSKLREYMEKYGTGGNWIALPKKAGLKRCGKSCRLRWLNYLRPNIKHGEFSEEEDTIICSLFATIGSRWSIIAAQLPGRTDNDIKNYWNTKLKKKLMGMVASSHTSNPPPPFPSPLQTPSFSSLLLQQKNCSTPPPYYTPSVANIVEPFDPIIQSNLMHSYNIPSLLETQEKLGLLGHNPMQYGYYPGGKYNLFMFGSEASTCSTYIKQEAAEMNSQNYIYNEVEENGSSGCFFGNNSTVQLGYEETEDVKQMMISGSTGTNGCNDTFFSDDKKTQEKAMMYYY